MSNIRLSKISIDSLSDPTNPQLAIDGGVVKINSEKASTDSITGALVVKGGVAISTSTDAINSLNGGGLSVAGGVAITKSLYVGGNINMDSTNSRFQISGTNVNSPRLRVSSITDKQISMSPDGVYNNFILTNSKLTISTTADSINSTTGAMVVSGGISIDVGTNSASVTAGGSLTVRGGGSFSRTLYVGNGIVSADTNTLGSIITTTVLGQPRVGVGNVVYPNYTFDVGGNLRISGGSLLATGSVNTLGNIFTNSVGSIGMGNSLPSSDYRLDITGNVRITSGNLCATNSTNTVGNMFTTGGNVGIGITSPSYKLHVSGGISGQFYTGANLSLSDDLICKNITTSNLVVSRIDASSYSGANLTLSNNLSTRYINAVDIITGSVISTDIKTTNISSSSGIIDLISCANINTNNNVNVNLTTSNIVVSGLISSSNLRTSVLTSGTVIASNVFSNNLNTANISSTIGNITVISSSNIYLSNNIYGIDTIYINRFSGENIISQNVSTGTVIASLAKLGTITGGSIVISDGITCVNINTSNITCASVSVQNLSTGNIVANVGNITNILVQNITSQNILLSGNLSAGSVLTGDINASGIVQFKNNQASDNSSTASVVLVGGLAIDNEAQVTSSTSGGALTVRGGVSVGKGLIVGGDVRISSGTISTNSQSGALVVSGGLGVGGTAYISGDAVVSGNLTVSGSTTSIVSTIVNINDNVILLNSGTSNSKNAGFMIKRWQTENENGLGDVVQIEKQTYLNFQLTEPAPDSTSLVLPISSSISSVDNYYVGWWIKIVNSLGASNNVRQITGYTGATRTISIDTPWIDTTIEVPNTYTLPSIGDIVGLFNKPYVGLIFNESEDRFEFAATTTDPNSSSLTVLENMPLTVSKLQIVSTDNINNSGVGGGLVVAGGASISKDLFVGGTVTSLSDKRIKQNIKPLVKNGESVLDQITNINGVRFNTIYDDNEQIGFLAQDFEEHFPQLLHKRNGDLYSLEYQKVTAILLECIKELRKEVQELKSGVFN